MRHLLDVNALIALGYSGHVFHDRAASWVGGVESGEGSLATCAITELGFVRILPKLPGFDGGLDGAKRLLRELKSKHPGRFAFVLDDHGADRLPGWVKTPKATTEGHLLGLAQAHGFALATLDTGIPGSFVIP